MAGYADELSLKLTAKDEMSARLKEARKELTTLEKQLVATKREMETTGAPEAAREYERLSKQYDEVAARQREMAKANAANERSLKKLRTEAGLSHTAMAKLGRGIEAHAKTIQRTGLVMGAAMALFAKASINAYAEAEKQQSILTTAYEKFPKVADVTRESFDTLNTSIMNLTGADDDALAASEGMLARFDLTGKQIQELIPLVNDYAILMGKDVTDASTAIGKALLGNTRALKDMGIDFQVTGDRGRDLAAIMVLLEEKAGGAGAAFGGTTAGQLAIANQNFENLKESVGVALVPALQQLVQVMQPAVAMFTAMPEPVKQVAFGFTALGVAAMIATPRLIAFNGALKGVGLSITALGPIAAILVGGAVATTQAYEAGQKFNEGQKTVAETVNENAGLLGFLALGFGNLRSVIARVTGSTEAATAATQDSADATRESGDVARVTGAAASRLAAANRRAAAAARAHRAASQLLADAHRAAAAAADVQSYAEGRLSGALGRAERALARRAAMRAYRQAMADFIATPSAEAGDAVSSAMLAAADTFKDPEKRAKFVKQSYKDLESAVKGSSLPSDIAQKVTAPLHAASVEAQILLNTMRQVAGAVNGTTAGNAPYTPIRRAAGGMVRGPGTGTSDSIPARLSNGEYVIRAAAVRAIGTDTLNRLNVADRTPVLPAIVNAPTITLPAQPVGRDAPLVGQMVIHASSQIDVELALAREARRQERDRRTRTAGTR